MDFPALSKHGALFLIEYKHGTSTSGIYLSPIQIGLYCEIFNDYISRDKKQFHQYIYEIIEQRKAMGLIHKNWQLPKEIRTVVPILLISEYNPSSSGMVRFREILDLCRTEMGSEYLKDLQIWSYTGLTNSLKRVNLTSVM